MKNIQDYTPQKYIDGKEYTMVEPHIYKTMEERSLEGISLRGCDKELQETIRNLTGWKKGTGREEDFYILDYNGVRYYKDEEGKEQIIYTEEPLQELYVTSIVYELEPEFEENAPSEAFISQYPLEDILEKFYVTCYDEYKEENENDKQHSYLEFASPDIEDIRGVRTIIGKHVYNVTDGKYVHLKIE
ncbi:hypothetical protein PIROE2DRAFT_18818 [Piromyces sp. E2]|nr:hypothetical protein PIROE2DRAFT_18818 [Piromyces sp. E2]|eukprot:OUM56537.1 hypothetical protein PIROE2DRAFT_18818 [Piromyces sp. E2]